ncbi:hypothetical protein A2U01_0061773, partial [Trifolium medium]|nr:hypothetical protein [Trifolium medium]
GCFAMGSPLVFAPPLAASGLDSAVVFQG